MVKPTYILQAVNVNQGLHFSINVSYDVYLRMRRYLDEHNCRYKIISTDEYVGKDMASSNCIDTNYILQFESIDYYHKMVAELVSFEIKVLNNE